MVKNVFNFILKALFILKISDFCPEFLDHVGLDMKAKVIFKIYDVVY